MSLLEQSKSYVPVYPKLVEITLQHERAHWGEWEAKLQQDVEQWKRGDITEDEKRFISSVLRLFTQSDVAVGSDYYDNLIPAIRNNEARNMLGSFAGREGVHQRAYALLNDTLGFGEEFYTEYTKFKAMKDKLDWIITVGNGTTQELAQSIAKQVLAEGVCLFSIFVELLKFSREGKMMGMSDVNQWSVRDESIHVAGLGELFRILCAENPQMVTDEFKRAIYQTARDCIKLEDEFISEIYRGQTEGVGDTSATATKQYVRSVCDYRMVQLGFKPEYNVDNPYQWMDWVVGGSTVENFFESNTTGYSKDAMKGSYKDAY